MTRRDPFEKDSQASATRGKENRNKKAPLAFETAYLEPSRMLGTGAPSVRNRHVLGIHDAASSLAELWPLGISISARKVN